MFYAVIVHPLYNYSVIAKNSTSSIISTWKTYYITNQAIPWKNNALVKVNPWGGGSEGGRSVNLQCY